MDKFSILIVEDNYNNIVSLRAILNKIEKCTYDNAQTGSEALKMLLKNKYNLIMLDIHLPDMDGYELASMIKSRSKTADLPVVFVTGVYLTEIDKQKGFRLGAVDYILKPYTELELQNKIKQYINAFDKNQQYIIELREVNRRLTHQNTMLIEAQSKQKESESKWKQLVENIPDYIILLDENYEIIY